jgi:hypothetical protein
MAKYLTDQAVADLVRMKARIRALEQSLGDDSTRPLYQTAHFLVETPESGIPAKDDTVPGEAECNMARRWGSASPKEIEVTGRKIKVYNPTAKVIKGFAIAHRDAYGDYYAFDSEPAPECEEIDLTPGVYKAFAGANFGPGDSLTVYFSGNGEDVGDTYTAVNQSECGGKLGDRIFLGVSPDCEIFFTPCTCCGDGEDDDCCDIKVAICICGVQKVISVNGGTATWDLSECCDCEGASLTITLTCETSGEPPVTTITGSWDYECGETTDSGTIDLTSLCNDEENVELSGLIEIEGCTICDDYRNFVGECEPCVPPDEDDEPCEDCPACCGPEWSIPPELRLTVTSSTCGTISNVAIPQDGIGTNWREGIAGLNFCGSPPNNISEINIDCTSGSWGIQFDFEGLTLVLVRCTPKLRLVDSGTGHPLLGNYTIEINEP